MVNVAILGFGTVGSGVAEVLTDNAESIAINAHGEIKLKYIVDVRDFPGSPFEKYMTKDFSVVEKDETVSVVVETIGGCGVAYDFTKRALTAGKSVVTSNKELVAEHGLELLTIAREKNVNYFFEASVGGGIPIIQPITECLASNKINEIYGILNGTTNFILTKMVKEGAGYEESLKTAQSLGYAEQDPTADVEGYDALRKICILANLCFGKNVAPAQVKSEGISGITANDVEYARRLGCKIKLLGRAVRADSGHVAAYVAPHLIDKTSLLSNVDGVMNGIVVHGTPIGEAMFYGAGAGKLPTASAVSSDVVNAARISYTKEYYGWEESPEGYVYDADLLKMKWYVRTGSDLEKIGQAFGRVRLISYPGEYPGAGPDEYAFVTEAMDKPAVLKKLDGMEIRSLFRVL